MPKSRTLIALTTMVLCACYMLIATLYLGLKNFDHLIFSWGQDLQMTVYLKESSEPTEVEKLINELKQKSVILNVSKISAEENFKQFKTHMASVLPAGENQTELQALIPPTLQILFNLKDSLTDPVKIFSEIAMELRSYPAVEEVSYGQLWVEKFSGLFTIVRQLLWLTTLVLAVASIFIFSNSVRSLVESKRYEIEVLELVGATNWRIRKPFVKRGALLGFSSGVTAIVLVALTVNSLAVSLAESEMLSSMAGAIQNFTLQEGLTFIALATAAGIFAAYLCVREINNGWAALERR